VKIEAAISASKAGMAERPPTRSGDPFVYAKRTAVGIRIVASYTDPTVVRKPNKTDLGWLGWRPVS
jgi:hypothetical protein